MMAPASDSPVATLSFRPTSSLRARGRVTDRQQQQVAGDSGSESTGRYFKILNSRRSYTIEQMLEVRTKFTARPADLGDFPCIEVGADDMLTWGLLSTPKNATKQQRPRSQKRDVAKKTTEGVKVLRTASAEEKAGVDGGVAPLAQGENRWRRTHEEGFVTIIGKLKGVLNKLTVDKFDSLAARFADIAAQNCKTEEDLSAAVQLVFDKALAETNFGDMYPNLCVMLAHKLPAITVKSEDITRPPRTVTFKSVILALCQQEFEKAFREIRPDRSMTPDDIEELRVKQRLRMLGNMQFLGELFKMSMINSKIVVFCANQLSSADPPNSSHLESLCALLSVVGKSLDAGARTASPVVDLDQLNLLFARLEKLSASSAVQPRTRFLIRDILDLRASEWVPRRKKVGAMKIAKLHEQEGVATRPNLSPSQQIFGIEPPTVRLVSCPTSTSTSRSESSRRGARRQDRYARAFNRTPSSRTVSDKDLASRYELGPSAGAGATSEPELESTAVLTSAVAEPTIPAIEQSVICRKTRNIVNEFIGIKDVKEAIECLDEIEQTDNSFRNRQIAVEALNQGMAIHSADERSNAILLLKELRSRDKISLEELLEGCQQVLEDLPDVVVDLPIAPKRLGEMLGALVASKCLPQSFISSEDADKLCAQVYAIAREQLS